MSWGDLQSMCVSVLSYDVSFELVSTVLVNASDIFS